jgi:hypothetical protein
MTARRLAIIKVCAVCAESFRPCKHEQLTCSSTCGAIRRVKMHPAHHQMQAAGQANARKIAEGLAAKLAGKTAVEAHAMGYKRGYATCYQRYMRDMRKRA